VDRGLRRRAGGPAVLLPDWRHDVSVVLNSSGKLVQWTKYWSYGRPRSYPAYDLDMDGDFDATDEGTSLGGCTLLADADLDGDNDAADITWAKSTTDATYPTLGDGVLSGVFGKYTNRRGYAGYEYDPTFEGADRHLYHVANRVMDSDRGEFIQRDQLDYVNYMNMYDDVKGLLPPRPHALKPKQPPKPIR
jgi:hypothetical protein